MGPDLESVDDDALDAEVDALAAKLASLPPLGLAAIKQIIRTSWQRTLDQELDLQRDEMRRLGFTDDYREGVAAFLEKRPRDLHGASTLLRQQRSTAASGARQRRLTAL